jgi:hypothetical protein
MLAGVHDSLLVGYSVSSRSHEIVLSIDPHHGNAPRPFSIRFTGVAAHQFVYPHLPSILFAIDELPAEKWIRDKWTELVEGSRENGWPGFPVETVEEASEHLARESLLAFEVSSSYGLSGWVLAKALRVEDAP